MIIFMVLTSVIYSHQERKFSMLESWMKSHTSDLTSVKSEFQYTGGDLEKKVSELQNLVFSLSSYLNTSGSSNPDTREMQIKKLSNIETLMSDLGSSLSSLASKQEEKLQKLERQQDTSHTEVKSLMDGLSSEVSTLRSKLTEDSPRSILRTQRFLVDMSKTLTDLKNLMSEVKSSVQSLSYRLSFTNLLIPGCTESGWIPFRNSCYLFSHDSMTWTKAKNYCEEKGALLLKIEDGSEREWKMDNTEEYSKLEMECEPRKSFQRDLPCRRLTVILLGTVCMIIFMVLTSVIYSHQERKFSMLESWMKSHTSDLTSVKSEFQYTGGDLEKKVSELQNLVFSLSSYLNTSGSSNPDTREMQIKKLSNIETLMSDLGSSLSSLASKQEEKLQKLERQQDTSHTEVKSLMDGLSSEVSTLRSKLTEDSPRSILRTQRFLVDMSKTLTDLKNLMSEVKSSVQSLSYRLSFTNLLIPGCTESGWIPFRNSCYLFSHDSMTWTKAKNYCEEKGALLLKIEDGSEREWKMDNTEEYSKLEMECEPRKSFQRDLPCRRLTVILLGTVCMIIFMVLTSVIYSHQERKFSMLESWMKSHTSDLTSVKSEFQYTGGDLEKKVSELQNLVFSLSSYLNTSGSSNPDTREMQIKKLSNIETLMSDLGSSLSSLASKQEEKLQKLERQQDTSHTEVKSLMDGLSSEVSTLRSKLTEDSPRSILRTQRFLVDMSKSLTDLKNLMSEVKSSVQSLSYRLSFTNLLIPGCTESGWIPFRNSCYLFSHDSMTWTKAKNYCEEKGALLLKIEDGSEREWEFVTSTAKPQEYWTGLTDQNTGQWRWADETPYTMNKIEWSPGQPDDWKDHGLGEEGEDCVHITAYGLLNDAHCSIKMNYICERRKQD
ncbi:uncharacterized protein LOC113069993 isoform X2 [Carassius auratus]|nr:uncharacterized protein LOC113069993 isoform X2 [Carassius auratus]XP_026098939.1 uncharacterized protein LOC113069993 isoform X2 [Carassius auratus]